MKLNEDDKKAAVIVYHNGMALSEIQEFAGLASQSDDFTTIATYFGLIASRASVEAERILGESASKQLVAMMVSEQVTEETETEEEVSRQVVKAVERIHEDS